MAAGVYDQLVEVGTEFGMGNAGMYAVESLRMEKGYRHWGHELDTDTTPLEARLTFAVKMKKACTHNYNTSTCMLTLKYSTLMSKARCRYTSKNTVKKLTCTVYLYRALDLASCL